MDAKALEKKDRLLAALEKGMVMIHLDARRPGVSVPPSFRAETHVRLNLSYRFDPPDLTVNEWGVRCTLSFSGSRYGCAVPWSALFAVVSHVTQEFWMFPEDMPPELLKSQDAKAAEPMLAPPARPVLREVVRPVDDAAASGVPGSPSDAPVPAQTARDTEPVPLPRPAFPRPRMAEARQTPPPEPDTAPRPAPRPAPRRALEPTAAPPPESASAFSPDVASDRAPTSNGDPTAAPERAQDPGSGAGQPPEGAPPPKGRGHLRVVK